MLLVASDRAPRAATIEWLTSLGARKWVAEDRASAVEAARLHQPEVAIVELGLRECEGPAVALQVQLCARHVETIFFAGLDEEGEVAAARDLGLGRVVLFDELFERLEPMLLPLAERARLRRRLAEVETLVQRSSSAEQTQSSEGRIALPEAERRYRETYIRSLLAETGNRREAARRAGVPYTTLCEIIRKLRIANA